MQKFNLQQAKTISQDHQYMRITSRNTADKDIQNIALKSLKKPQDFNKIDNLWGKKQTFPTTTSGSKGKNEVFPETQTSAFRS